MVGRFSAWLSHLMRVIVEKQNFIGVKIITPLAFDFPKNAHENAYAGWLIVLILHADGRRLDKVSHSFPNSFAAS
jgi:hypothetical protein